MVNVKDSAMEKCKIQNIKSRQDTLILGLGLLIALTCVGMEPSPDLIPVWGNK